LRLPPLRRTSKGNIKLFRLTLPSTERPYAVLKVPVVGHLELIGMVDILRARRRSRLRVREKAKNRLLISTG